MVVEFKWPIIGVVIPFSIISVCGFGVYWYVAPHTCTKSSEVHWFGFALFMTYLNYLLAIVVSPGTTKGTKDFEYLPGEWKRWCVKCNLPKPERSHHCRQCGVCVLKMDHHCPWTANCVGHKNFPHFTRFLIWVIITTTVAIIHVCRSAVSIYQQREVPEYLGPPRSQIWATFALVPLLSFVEFTVGILLYRVLMSALLGRTQIEEWEVDRAKLLAKKRLFPKTEFPYDIDPLTNLLNFLGSPILFLIWPLQGPGSDGLHFEKNEMALDKRAVWPPDHVDQPGPPPKSNVQQADSNRTLGYSTAQIPKVAPEYRRSSQLAPTTEATTSNRRLEAWHRDQFQSSDGDRITDYGVDLATEVSYEYLEEDVPLGSLYK